MVMVPLLAYNAPVLDAASGADLFPEFFYVPADTPDYEPTDEENAKDEAFQREFVRDEDLKKRILDRVYHLTAIS